MIVYHPAYDVSHCLYRMLLLLENLPNNDIEWERLQLLDFLILFPSLLKNISFPSELRSARKTLTNIQEPYENIPNPTRLMFELDNIQKESVSSLIARGFIDKDKIYNNIVSRTNVELPMELSNKMLSDNVVKEPWFLLLVNNLSILDFYGAKGLKARTGMMEYRYDI
ncbi:MAG: hypothetical protein P4L44_10835 [Oryzomonas sp.]|uniref:ABC-three component system middle component 5 n=1 Tax=Oryzomonas sp. TaxID=2855186 RepID=UPI00283F0A83|nr:ABC-three component system middle component 5 [Oryzomonas sp.]MDR3580447.1 hypothetical protein [Oryzomonas sp.]